jgi:hypothetical protein
MGKCPDPSKMNSLHLVPELPRFRRAIWRVLAETPRLDDADEVPSQVGRRGRPARSRASTRPLRGRKAMGFITKVQIHTPHVPYQVGRSGQDRPQKPGFLPVTGERCG